MLEKRCRNMEMSAWWRDIVTNMFYGNSKMFRKLEQTQRPTCVYLFLNSSLEEKTW